MIRNYFFIESEVAHRQFEWERTITAMTQTAQMRPENGRKRLSHLPLLALTYLRSLATPRVWQSRHGGAPTRGAAPSSWQEIVPLGPDRAAVG